MNSLSELNGFGATSLTVADDRPSKVIFDRVAPLGPVDQILTVTSTTVSIGAGINIVEVVNYPTANVRYQIIIRTSGSPLLTGSTITWPSLPSGVVLTVVGSTYVLSGINTPAIWEQIKNFTWNLPAGYASSPQWYLDISIIYYDSALGQDVSVDYVAYDPIYYKVSEMEITSSMTCIGEDARLVSASLNCQTVLFFEPKLLEGIIDTVSTNFSIVCDARLVPDDELFPFFSLNCLIGVIKKNNINCNSNFTIVPNLTILISNLYNRNFIANKENTIFAVDPPFIEDGDPLTTATFTINFQCDVNKGYFSKSSVEQPTNNFSYSGTRSQVNNILSQIRFYSYPGQTTNTTVTYTQTKNSVLQTSQTFTLLYNAGTYTGNIVTLTVSNIGAGYQNVTLPNEDILYSSNTDILLIGGGGRGGEGPGGVGGGGGEVIELFNYGKLTFSAYSMLAGRGGQNINFGTGLGDGENTVAFGQTARGGRSAPGAGAPGASGGGNGGGAGLTWEAYGSYVSYAGGGGGGHGAVGQPATLINVNIPVNNRYVQPGNGGPGYLSLITNEYYAAGGGGGSYEFEPFNSGRIPISAGGNGGGGAGGKSYRTQIGSTISFQYTLPISGTNGKGAGGGGGAGTGTFDVSRIGGNGGSGAIILKFKP